MIRYVGGESIKAGEEAVTHDKAGPKSRISVQLYRCNFITVRSRNANSYSGVSRDFCRHTRTGGTFCRQEDRRISFPYAVLALSSSLDVTSGLEQFDIIRNSDFLIWVPRSMEGIRVLRRSIRRGYGLKLGGSTFCPKGKRKGYTAGVLRC